MAGKPKYTLARKPPAPAKKDDGYENDGIGFSSLTKAIWAGVFAVAILIGALTSGDNKPTDAKKAEYIPATIVAIGKDFVLAEDDAGGEHRTRSTAILAAVKRGDLILGDQIRVPK